MFSVISHNHRGKVNLFFSKWHTVDGDITEKFALHPFMKSIIDISKHKQKQKGTSTDKIRLKTNGLFGIVFATVFR
jgi:hypothetical protein